MPLENLNSLDAMRVRKANEFASWGTRNEENRVEPITMPAFGNSILLKPGEAIFTIGSCFARNVENTLEKLGYRIPMRDLFKQPQFKGLEHGIVNNFGTPSIYNELAWAFGEADFEEDLGFVEVRPDRFVDLHMINSLRPTALEQVRARRSGLLEATRSLADCRLLIMTLGLVELWWDEDAQIYLNTAPLPSIINRWPKRFSLHVLDFNECYEYLKKAVEIVFKYGRKDLQIILTVSPVPMAATHRRMDVITANSYSKSVLRAAAEHCVCTNENVSYFPSFETVTMSDRRASWLEDMVHVTPGMVEINVQRLASAFSGKSDPVGARLPEAIAFPQESTEALLLAARARQARVANDREFFRDNVGSADTSPAFALEFARFLHEEGRHEEAIELIRTDERTEVRMLRAQAQLAIGECDGAIASLLPLCKPGIKGHAHWRLLLDATIFKRKNASEILDLEAKWLEALPRERKHISLWIAQALMKAGADRQANERLQDLVTNSENPTNHMVLELALSLIRLNQYADALGIIKGVIPENDTQASRVDRLKKRALEHMNQNANALE